MCIFFDSFFTRSVDGQTISVFGSWLFSQCTHFYCKLLIPFWGSSKLAKWHVFLQFNTLVLNRHKSIDVAREAYEFSCAKNIIQTNLDSKNLAWDEFVREVFEWTKWMYSIFDDAKMCSFVVSLSCAWLRFNVRMSGTRYEQTESRTNYFSFNNKYFYFRYCYSRALTTFTNSWNDTEPDPFGSFDFNARW